METNKIITDSKIYTINNLEIGHHKRSIKEFNSSHIEHVGYMPQEIKKAPSNINQGYVGDTIIENMQLEESLDNVKTLYRFPKISLSRDKVKLWTDKNNAKVIRDANIADIKIFSVKQINILMHENWYCNWCTKQEFLNAIATAQKDFKLFLKSSYESIYDMFNTQIEDDGIILLTRDYYYSNDDQTKWSEKFHEFKNNLENLNTLDNVKYWIPNTHWKAFCATRTGSFMLDSVANKLMSTDSVTFNDEMYLNVKDMIRSGNNDDITVAMTTIANCHIEESRTYLALLFFHYNENYFKRVRFYNSVSFKAVRTDFQKYADLVYGHSNVNVYDTLINHLMDDKALTVNAMEHLLDLVFENVIMGSTGMKSSKSFTIKRSSISLTPEALEKVNKRPNKDLTREILEIQNEMIDLPF